MKKKKFLFLPLHLAIMMPPLEKIFQRFMAGNDVARKFVNNFRYFFFIP